MPFSDHTDSMMAVVRTALGRPVTIVKRDRGAINPESGTRDRTVTEIDVVAVRSRERIEVSETNAKVRASEYVVATEDLGGVQLSGGDRVRDGGREIPVVMVEVEANGSATRLYCREGL